MWKWMSSFWENYKYRFVPWIVMNLRQKKQTGSTLSTMHSSKAKFEPQSQCQNDMQELHQLSNAEMTSRGSVIVHNVSQGDDKLLTDNQLTGLMISFFDKLLEYEKEHGKIGQNFSSKDVIEANDMSSKSKELMHKVFGYSVERRKSHVSEEAGTGVFLASGQAPAGSLIALYPGTVYMPSEPLFFPSLGNSFIFRCSDNVHIDGNDKWISKSIYKSCAARDKFHVDLPCCDETWLTKSPLNPLNVGQYVNNRSKMMRNNVVYQESQIIFGSDSISTGMEAVLSFPIRLCKYLPNVWANPDNNHHPLRVVPLVSVKEIKEGEEILSSYFTLVHASSENKTSDNS